MQSLSAEFLAAAMAAKPEHLKEALAVLKGMPRPASVPSATVIVREPFVTLEALSKATGIGRITLWRYNVPGHTHAGRMRYRVSEVLAYLDSPMFKKTVQALKTNGWKRLSAAEVARVTLEDSASQTSAQEGVSPHV
jgi:hypothetical protein